MEARGAVPAAAEWQAALDPSLWRQVKYTDVKALLIPATSSRERRLRRTTTSTAMLEQH